MKLKPKKLAKTTMPAPVEEEKKPRKKSQSKLPKEGYTPIFEPKRFKSRETESYKDGSAVKQYIEVSVKRIDDDNKDEATPYVWVQMYQESNFYTGYLKGKSVYIPLDVLPTLIQTLSEVMEEGKDITL